MLPEAGAQALQVDLYDLRVLSVVLGLLLSPLGNALTDDWNLDTSSIREEDGLWH